MDIFDIIMSQRIKYSIMNDYNRSCNLESREEVRLNGDTCVHWMLDLKQNFRDPKGKLCEKDGEFDLDLEDLIFGGLGFDERMFNITEDQHIDEHESDGLTKRLLTTRLEVQLLHTPLPLELPTVQKDLLIACAAYYGDVDRYARLRRPARVHLEVTCCVRGINHNTLFAVWWSKQPGKKPYQIEEAINARFIMNIVVSTLPYARSARPYLIWWPTKAQPSTYRHLAKVQPNMLPQIIHACIYAGYDDLFDELVADATPNQAHLREAERSWSLQPRLQGVAGGCCRADEEVVGGLAGISLTTAVDTARGWWYGDLAKSHNQITQPMGGRLCLLHGCFLWFGGDTSAVGLVKPLQHETLVDLTSISASWGPECRYTRCNTKRHFWTEPVQAPVETNAM